MTKLNVSLDGAEYSDSQKLEMWIDIYIRALCPECASAESLFSGPKGGIGRNISCRCCGTTFFTTPFSVIGAYPTSRTDTLPCEGEVPGD